MNKKATIRIAIFASGTGSNAEKIMAYFMGSSVAQITLLVCNKEDAFVIQVAKRFDIPVLLIGREIFFKGNGYLPELQKQKIDFIVLAGFLWKIPPVILHAYPNAILNIHPALLPQYGGKGMYGHHVHETVLKNKESYSGITIHYVDELYDHGKIVFQEKCPVYPDDTPETLAARVLTLEHRYFAPVIEDVILSKLNNA